MDKFLGQEIPEKDRWQYTDKAFEGNQGKAA